MSLTFLTSSSTTRILACSSAIAYILLRIPIASSARPSQAAPPSQPWRDCVGAGPEGPFPATASAEGRLIKGGPSHCRTCSEDETMRKFALRVLICCLVFVAFTFPSAQAQVQEPAENKGAAAAYRALLCLRSTATVL